MKNLKKTIALVALMCVSIFKIEAQETNNSLLWKVEGNGIKTSYVFGTFHMLPKEDFNLKQHVIDAINKTELTVLELDMDDPGMQAEMMKHAAMPEGKTLLEYMDQEEVSIVDAYLKEKLGVGLENFKSFKPLMVSSMVMVGYLGKDYASYEAELIKLTTAGEKEVKGLETIAFQMSAFDKQPYDEQLDDIVKLLQEKESMSTMFNEMISIYKKEDINALYDFMDEYFDNDLQKMDALLHARNTNWIPQIAAFSKDAAVFYGVGAGHLGGDQGVISLLKKAGYKVTPILK